MKTHKVLGLSVLAGLMLATPVLAAEFIHSGNGGNIDLPANETHNNLHVAGSIVTISGPIKGDLIAAGGIVKVAGNVENDLFLAGGRLDVDATIGKNVHAAGGTLEFNKAIGGDLIAAGRMITLTKTSSVAGDLVVAGGQVVIDGKVNGNLTVVSKQELTFGPDSQVLGTINYKGTKPAVVDSNAKIGTINYTQLDTRGMAHAFRALFALATLFKLIALLIAGFVFYYLFPGKIHSVLEKAMAKPWHSLGIGLLAAIVTPIAIVILMVTLIGIYLGIILLLVYLLMLILASVLMFFYFGQLVYGWYNKSASVNIRRDLILGAVIVLIVSLIPFIGWLALAITYLITLGALTTDFYKEHLRR